MNKNYSEPNFEVVKIEVEDVITTSNPGEIIPGENETPGGGGL